MPAKGVQLDLDQVNRKGNLGSKHHAFPTTFSQDLIYRLERYPFNRYLKAYKLV